MSQKITMDMELRFIDNASGGAKSTSKALDQIEKEAKAAGQEIDNLSKKKAKPSVDADASRVDKKLNKIDATLKKLGFRKTKTTIDADDKATAKITRALNKVKGWAGKKFNAFLELKDSNALRTLNKMSDGLRSLASKTFRVPVKLLDYATRPLRSLQNMLFSIKGLVAAITAGFAAQQLIINPINLADAYSSAQIGFSTLLGESRGQQMMDDLDAFAKATPFKSSQVISQTQRMLAMGWDAESIIDDMTIIGDAAAATGKGEAGLQQIVTALAQIKTKGRLSTEELNQLAEAGISAKRYLAEGLGYGTGDEGIAAMTKDLEDGAIASNAALQALLSGMQEYKGMMDKTANETVTGLWSQISDTFEINIARRWGQGLQDGAKRSFGSIVELINEADGALTEFGDTVYEVGKDISNWAADKLEDTVQRITDITGSYEFQNANLGEKISVLWNGVVVDPLKEWWEGGGRDKTVETAGEIGEWMGKTITEGLLAIFGVTDILDDETANKLGESGGMSIAQSFAKGFKENFDGAAITEALVDAISNVWNALPTWGKILIGGYGIGKAAGGLANLAGGVSSLIGGATSIIGSAGAMTGILGFGTKAAIGMGAGNLAGGASLGAGALSALGLGATAGGLAAGASLIKGGVDLYRGYTTDNEIEAQASKTSGYAAIGGVAGGAAIGATIGSVIPGLGTLVGGLIGAGIGGIGGWLLGDHEADKIRATDDAINDVTAAVEDLETEEEKLERKNKMVWQNMKDHFGDITLSMTEIKRLADQIVWGKDLASYEKFVSATQQAEASMQSMNAAGEQTDRWMWKAGLGVTFNEDEIESIKESFDQYIASAQSYLDNKHYEFTAAVSLLVDPESEGGKSIIESGNAFYGKYKEDLDAAGKELGDLLTESIADGFINADEQAAIIAAQQKIAEITQKIADAETSAELQLIDLKFGEGNLDLDSFDSFMTQMQTTLDARMSANDEAFKVSVASLQLQLQEGAISQEEYDNQLQTLVDGYTGKVDSLKAQIMDVELEIIGEAYAEDGVTKEKLTQALQDSLAQGIDPITWTTEQARQFLGLDSLSESSADAVSKMLSGVADQLEIVEVDGQLYFSLVEGGTDVEEVVKSQVPDQIDDSVRVEITPIKLVEVIDEVLPEDFNVPDYVTESVILKLNAVETVQEQVDILASEFGIKSEEAETILWKLTGEKSVLNTVSVTASDFGVPDSVDKTVTVNITSLPNYLTGNSDSTGGIPYAARGQGFRGGIFGGSSALESFARGGIVRGGSKLIEVAEEGSPEMVIPLSSQRRNRALQLWEKAGEMMRVPGFARGGRTDGGADEGIRFMGHGSGEASGGQSVQVDVGGVKVEIHVNSDGSTNIAEAVKAQLGEITDAVVGAIADELGALFENTPVRGVA